MENALGVGEPEDEASLTPAVGDIALIDLNYTRDTTSGREGLDLLERIGPKPTLGTWGSNPGRSFEACKRWAAEQ